MSRDVADWLRGLGLVRYAAAFRDNEIGWEVLPRLTAADLSDLGVVLGEPPIAQHAETIGHFERGLASFRDASLS